MTVDTVLKNAKAYLKGEILDCSIALEEGMILKIGKQTHMPNADEKIDLKNLLVLPGVVDSHVHLRDEGKAYKETFFTGTASAAAGGVTTVLDMPNNAPITMSRDTLLNRMEIAKRRVVVNVGFYAAFPSSLEELKDVVAAGAVGFKLFMAEQIGGLNIDDDEELGQALQETAKSEIPVAIHAEDKTLLKNASEKLKLTNHHDLAAFLKAHSETVEVEAIRHLLRVNQYSKARLHFCHVSTEQGLNTIAKAKSSNENVTCEVTPHHLLLTKTDLEQLGSTALTMPPLRNKTNVDALWKGVTGGTVDVIGSDHAPHALEEKAAGSIWDVKVGVPGLETILPLMLTMVKKNRLTLARLVQLLSEKPAEIFGLTDRGSIEVKKRADIVAVDFNRKFKVDASKFFSKAKFSPFNGWEVNGKPVKTFVNGKLVFDEEEIVAEAGSGGIFRRGQAS